MPKKTVSAAIQDIPTKELTAEDVLACAKVINALTLSNKEVAEMIGVNTTYFRTLFRSGEGCTDMLTHISVQGRDFFLASEVEAFKAAREDEKQIKAEKAKRRAAKPKTQDTILNLNMLRVLAATMGLVNYSQLKKEGLKELVMEGLNTVPGFDPETTNVVDLINAAGLYVQAKLSKETPDEDTAPEDDTPVETLEHEDVMAGQYQESDIVVDFNEEDDYEGEDQTELA